MSVVLVLPIFPFHLGEWQVTRIKSNGEEGETGTIPCRSKIQRILGSFQPTTSQAYNNNRRVRSLGKEQWDQLVLGK